MEDKSGEKKRTVRRRKQDAKNPNQEIKDKDVPASNKILPENECELVDSDDNIQLKDIVKKCFQLSEELENLMTQSSINYKIYKKQLEENKRLQLKCEALENEKTALQNKLSATENKLSANENKLSATENKLSATENKLSATENKLLAASKKKQKMDTQYEQNMNPINYINEIHQNSSEIPIYTVIDEKRRRHYKEIIVQCSLGTYVSYGYGPDEETAKYYATQAMHRVIKYSNLVISPGDKHVKSHGIEQNFDSQHQNEQTFEEASQIKNKKRLKK